MVKLFLIPGGPSENVGSETVGAFAGVAERAGVKSSQLISSGCENIQSAARSTLLSVFCRALTHCERLKPIDCSIATPSSFGLKVSAKYLIKISYKLLLITAEINNIYLMQKMVVEQGSQDRPCVP